MTGFLNNGVTYNQAYPFLIPTNLRQLCKTGHHHFQNQPLGQETGQYPTRPVHLLVGFAAGGPTRHQCTADRSVVQGGV